MFQKLIAGAAVLCLLAFCANVGNAQEPDKKSGKLIGEIKSKMDTPNGKNVFIEVLAFGEEKARKYRVLYDPKLKGVLPEVLAAVKAAKVGDRVELMWVDTGEGYAIKAFKVLQKTTGGDTKEGNPKDPEKKSGTVVGELKAKKDVANGKNIEFEVQAFGEEKARKYHVWYDPAVKGGLPKIVDAVRDTKIGERVEMMWEYTGHGPAIKTFKVLKKTAGGDGK